MKTYPGLPPRLPYLFGDPVSPAAMARTVVENARRVEGTLVRVWRYMVGFWVVVMEEGGRKRRSCSDKKGRETEHLETLLATVLNSR